MVLQSETDLLLLDSASVHQPDSDNLRVWEVAGAAHADTYISVAAAEDDGTLAPAELAKLLAPTTEFAMGSSDIPINAGPQMHYVGQAALDHLHNWARGGHPAPSALRLNVDDRNRALEFDDHGNATGGVRTPWVDVPLERLSGLGQTADGVVALCGVTVPFDAPTLQKLYPGGEPDFLSAFTSSLDASIRAGFIRATDRTEILGIAQQSYFLRRVHGA